MKKQNHSQWMKNHHPVQIKNEEKVKKKKKKLHSGKKLSYILWCVIVILSGISIVLQVFSSSTTTSSGTSSNVYSSSSSSSSSYNLLYNNSMKIYHNSGENYNNNNNNNKKDEEKDVNETDDNTSATDQESQQFSPMDNRIEKNHDNNYNGDDENTIENNNHDDDANNDDDDNDINKLEEEHRTVIVLIAMGSATSTNHLRRCLWSLQRQGQWGGYILILTDISKEILENSLFLSNMEIPTPSRAEKDLSDIIANITSDSSLSSSSSSFPSSSQPNYLFDSSKIVIMAGKPHDLKPVHVVNVTTTNNAAAAARDDPIDGDRKTTTTTTTTTTATTATTTSIGDENTTISLTSIRYKSPIMIYKRFKTLVIDYVQEQQNIREQRRSSSCTDTRNPSFHHTEKHWKKDDDICSWKEIRYILYLDVDIVVAKPLHPFLKRQAKRVQGMQQKQKTMKGQQQHQQQQQIASSSPSSASNVTPMVSTLFMFPDCPTCAKNILNSGIIWMDMTTSRQCLMEWRNFFDSSPHTLRDQSLLRKVKKFAKSTCQLHNILPKSECWYPTWKDMRLFGSVERDITTKNKNNSTPFDNVRMADKKDTDHDINIIHDATSTTAPDATFVHNTNTYGSTKIPHHIQEAFFTKLLHTSLFSQVEHY